MELTTNQMLKEVIEREVNNVHLTDIHTHLYSADFNDLLLFGIDDLLIYHYVMAEYLRSSQVDYEKFFLLSKREQADLIWQELFINQSPVSEAQRGVLTILAKLGLDVRTRNLAAYREYFHSLTIKEYVDKIFAIAGVKEVIMTNDPFDESEHAIWQAGGNKDARFKSSLRIDPLLNDYESSYSKLISWGYVVDRELNEKTIAEIKRFLSHWVKKINALYMAVSLPASFVVPEKSNRGIILEKCVLPVCREEKIPLAMMIGVNRNINNKLGLASDSLGKADKSSIEYLCRTYPDNKFMVTMLARENQHELAVTGRKFRNLMIFGCWWFLNNPSLIQEITKIRIETLGLSFIPQHSDCRVLEQLIYKWEHSRKIIGKVLVEKYSDLLESGWIATEAEIKRDIINLFGNNFWNYIKK